jgi:hypothetical protein
MPDLESLRCPFCERVLNDPCEGPHDLRVCAFTPSTTTLRLPQPLNGQFPITAGEAATIAKAADL